MEFKKLFLAFLMLFGVVEVAAQPSFEVQAQVSSSEIYIGDQFVYEIVVQSADSIAVDLPMLTGNLAAFEVKDYQVQTQKVRAGWVYKWTLVLNTFVSGTYALPAQMVEVVSGADTVRTSTNVVPIKVLPRVDSAADEDIAEVDPVLHDGAWPLWLKIVLGILAAAALVGAGVYVYRKVRAREAQGVLPPYEEALAAVAALRQRQLLEQDLQAEYFFALGQILRRYLQRRFAVEVVDATAAEISRRLDNIPGLTGALREAMLEFVHSTDLVKFARQPLPAEQVAQLDQFADRLLQETRPQPEDEVKKAAEEGK